VFTEASVADLVPVRKKPIAISLPFWCVCGVTGADARAWKGCKAFCGTQPCCTWRGAIDVFLTK
jgi:hypothetical protein